MQRIVRVTAASVALFAAVGLAGCAATAEFTTAPSPNTTGETTAPSPNTTGETTVPSVTAGAPTTVDPAPCDAVLSQAGYDDLAAGNLTSRDFTVQAWDYPLPATFATDGVVCKWAGGGDVFVVLGQLPMDEATWGATRAELEADGYFENGEYGIDGFVDGPDGSDESYPARGFLWRDGMLYYVSYPGILEFVPAIQR